MKIKPDNCWIIESEWPNRRCSHPIFLYLSKSTCGDLEQFVHQHVSLQVNGGHDQVRVSSWQYLGELCLQRVGGCNVSIRGPRSKNQRLGVSQLGETQKL